MRLFLFLLFCFFVGIKFNFLPFLDITLIISYSFFLCSHPQLPPPPPPLSFSPLRDFYPPKTMKGDGGRSKTDTKKVTTKRKAADRGISKAAKKAMKDPNKPKRPPSAFFVFMEQFRKEFKELNPNNKSVAVVGKASGDKWRSLTDEEKAPYIAKAEKLKAEYSKQMDAYNNPKQNGESANVAEEEDEVNSDKSKSEVHDGEDDGSSSGADEDEDDDA
ncbi:HMG1/2-like protein [Zostera marina]|uniref:HMG1/2-like protein n=1 Tax=Zostera marina TaxID=29655 RepID=A0A0K9PFU4_ZOSMR|nr:HMG1/2-like protein [Zostera marina]